jgi:predicted nuclease with RNAse H fold
MDEKSFYCGKRNSYCDIMFVIGIDLATSPTIPSEIAIMNGSVIIKEVYTDEHILQIVDEYQPKVVAIDAPLSTPEDEWRSSDLEIMNMDFQMISPKIPIMLILTRRAHKLVMELRKNCKVIETNPKAVEEILAIEKIAVERKLDKILTDGEYDAFLCGLTAKAHFLRKTTFYGNPADINDQIFLPEKPEE